MEQAAAQNNFPTAMGDERADEEFLGKVFRGPFYNEMTRSRACGEPCDESTEQTR